MRLPGQLPLEQTQAQVVAQALVAELARLRMLVQAAVLELAPALAQALRPVREPVRVLEQPRVLEPLALELVREPVWEPVQQSELTAVPVQARELRVSRQLELSQHRLPTAAQELLPYLPALPMKAPCWGVPAW